MDVRTKKLCYLFCVVVPILTLFLYKLFYKPAPPSFKPVVSINDPNNEFSKPTKQLIADQLDEVYAEIEQLAHSSMFQVPRQELKVVFDNLDDAIIGLPPPTNSKRQSIDHHSYAVVNTDICQEKYAYDKLSGDFPHFYKGFNMLNCSGVPKFHTLLTLTYNFVHYSNDNLKLIPSLLADINKVYPQIKIIAAIPTSFALAEMDFRDLQLYRYDSSSAATDVWRDIISKVQTKYVYIGRNVIHFTWFDRLERLVREINNLNAVVVAAAFRTLHSGHWSNGCDQTIVNDYALVYRHGYHRSMEECLKCDHVHGPFVTKTELFTKMPLHEHMTETSGFAALFYSIKLNSELVVACPDSMSFVTDSSRSDTSKADWSSLARLLQVEEIHPTNGPKMTFSCQEAGTSCQMSQSSGLATSNCCRESVMAITKSAIQNCVVSNLLCSLEGPALSGALKFGGLSPWETTITISLHRDNFTSFSKIVVPMLEKDGYNVVTDNSNKAFVISSEHASVKVHSVSSVERDSPGGMRHTSLLFGDLLSLTPSNPALSLKQRYGTGFLEHMQRQQSINFTHISTFSSCLTPGHHACLDKYITDGNIQFRKPIS